MINDNNNILRSVFLLYEIKVTNLQICIDFRLVECNISFHTYLEGSFDV